MLSQLIIISDYQSSCYFPLFHAAKHACAHRDTKVMVEEEGRESENGRKSKRGGAGEEVPGGRGNRAIDSMRCITISTMPTCGSAAGEGPTADVKRQVGASGRLKSQTDTY